MQNDLVKLCPQCGSEFQMWVERCLDCGATLVHGLEGQGAGADGRPKRAEVAEQPAIPPDCVHLRTAAVDWIRRLSEDLDDAGIRHWAIPPGCSPGLSLYVSPSDEKAAALVDQARYAIEVPDVAAGQERSHRPIRQRRRDPSPDDLDVKVCPSCNGEYQLWAETCADCGVPLVRPWDLDSARESAAPQVVTPAFVAVDDPGACPACGESLPEGVLECPGCGLILSQPKVCPNCEAELETFVTKCEVCGHEIFRVPEGESF